MLFTLHLFNELIFLQEPVRSAIIDSCIRVTDNGRESYHRKVFFIFTLYNTSNHNDQLKVGITSYHECLLDCIVIVGSQKSKRSC
ncbi:hypothetical protein RJ640_021166 [Escallonia rubra]|uniref:Uncharacterized protein n=1 Tax=Escallonia rubra TaxID=112253 RepID=A0AA88R2T1_9ASTE|nr:hypothetical protein RJ640_021166 [Escallonia rubra]